MCQTRVADRVLDLQLDGHALDRHIVDAKLDANYHFMSVLESVVLERQGTRLPNGDVAYHVIIVERQHQLPAVNNGWFSRCCWMLFVLNDVV